MKKLWPPWRRSSGRTGNAKWIAVGILLAAALAYVLRWFVGWALNLLVRMGWFFDALPQDLVWAILVVVLVFLTLCLAGKAWSAKETRIPVAAPTPSDLAELVHLVRRAEFSPRARWRLGRRLAQAAVALRVRTEAIPPRRAWDDLDEGRWPPNTALQAVLRPGHGWRRPMRSADYPRQLQAAVDALWSYAQGGDLERN